MKILNTSNNFIEVKLHFQAERVAAERMAAVSRPRTASSLADRGRNEGRGASGSGAQYTRRAPPDAAVVFSAVCYANGRQAFDNVEDRCSDISSSLKQPRVASTAAAPSATHAAAASRGNSSEVRTSASAIRTAT